MVDDFKNYTKDDIINELFQFTDALRDNGEICSAEEKMLDDLREQYYKICEGKA